jgi:hypothetical protein
MEYIDLVASVVRRLSNSEELPQDGQVGPKHVAINAILMLL